MKAAVLAHLTFFAAPPPTLLAAPFSFSPFQRNAHKPMGSSQSSPVKIGSTPTSSVDNESFRRSSLGGESHVIDASNLSQIKLSQKHEQYNPPLSPIHPTAHYIFLVHGWLGNDLEMSYLAESFANCIAAEKNIAANDDESHHDAKRVKRSPSQLAVAAQKSAFWKERKRHPPIVVHSVKCNVGKTHDGIKNGGTRLAHEIVDFIRSDLQRLHSSSVGNGTNGANAGHDDGKAVKEESAEEHVTYSIVGNSLGGLYARYAISLVPRQLSIPRVISNGSPITASATDATNHSNNKRIHLHPNIFCTTATPHLGCSQHTYIQLPRFAENIVATGIDILATRGSGMGTTGRDLFRLNSDKNLKGSSSRETKEEDEIDEEMECVIRNMCLQEKYLGPLRNFKRRIAYANAYQTDFQVPTETAAFLNADSQVKHVVFASRDANKSDKAKESDAVNGGARKTEKIESFDDSSSVPPFVVAVVRTEQQPPPSSLQHLETTTPANELLKMSQSLDALGWTKVFIDVRDRIPLPGIPRPSWRLLPFPSPLSNKRLTPDSSLDDLIHSRGSNIDETAKSSASSPQHEATAKEQEHITLTSAELVQSTNAGETFHFPMGHTVMVANSKSETYTRLNYQGRPVMDRLAEEMLEDVLEFE